MSRNDAGFEGSCASARRTLSGRKVEATAKDAILAAVPIRRLRVILTGGEFLSQLLDSLGSLTLKRRCDSRFYSSVVVVSGEHGRERRCASRISKNRSLVSGDCFMLGR
jgi:hypothetical protein